MPQNKFIWQKLNHAVEMNHCYITIFGTSKVCFKVSHWQFGDQVFLANLKMWRERNVSPAYCILNFH
jgi:hypothetical protein